MDNKEMGTKDWEIKCGNCKYWRKLLLNEREGHCPHKNLVSEEDCYCPDWRKKE